MLSRYIRLHVAFFITALIHVPGVVILGESPFAIGLFKFFLMQAVGILIESMIFNIWITATKTRIDHVPVPAGIIAYLLGYIWVLAWISWTGPEYTWMVARAVVEGRDNVVPWSFIRWLGYRN
jgi:hypothetical protein